MINRHWRVGSFLFPFLLGSLSLAAGCGSDDDPPAGDGGVRGDAGDAGDASTDVVGDSARADVVDAGDMASNTDGPRTDEILSRLRLPAGFQINVFARDLGQPRWMTVTPDGSVFVTRRGDDIWRLRDSNSDGAADIQLRAYAGIEQLSGVTSTATQVFMMGKYLYVSPLSAEGPLTMPVPIVFDQHRQGGVTTDRALGIAPDGRIYISVAGEMPATGMPKPSIIRGGVSGGAQEVVALGLRNVLGFAWHPVSGELWATEQGSAMEGAGEAPDEINKVVDGANHGWPICTGKTNQVSATAPAPVTGTKEAFCAQATGAVLDLPAGSGASSLVFYNASHFPAEYKGDAFVALSGSQATPAAAGFKVVRVRFTNNQATAVEDFLTGFLAPGGTSSYGRPQGLAVAPDGSLLVTDESNGLIYRISRGTGSGTGDAGAGN
jgi:glucose/arabinose dehydrogenase